MRFISPFFLAVLFRLTTQVKEVRVSLIRLQFDVTDRYHFLDKKLSGLASCHKLIFKYDKLFCFVDIVDLVS